MIEKFRYAAYDETGVRREDSISAINLESAKFKLKELGMIPVSIKMVETSGKRLPNLFQFERRPGLADLEFLTSRMSLLLRNGIRLDRALLTSKKGLKNRSFTKIIEEIHEDVRSGTELSISLKKYPDIFDPLYVSVVTIGEATGALPQVFEDLAENLSFRQEIRNKTRQAMVYPSIIFAVCLLSVTFIFNFIVPRFSIMFSTMENLPIYTKMLLDASSFFIKYQLLAIPVITALILFFSRTSKREGIRRLKDKLALKLPVVKRLCYLKENLSFTSSLAILLRNGVVLSDALVYAEMSIGNVFLKKMVSIAKDEIKHGRKLSEAMEKTSFLPDMFNSLIEAGEQTGNLSQIFSEMQKRLKGLYELQVSTLITLIEPAMIILMGLLVGSVVVTMLLSIISINYINF